MQYERSDLLAGAIGFCGTMNAMQSHCTRQPFCFSPSLQSGMMIDPSRAPYQPRTPICPMAGSWHDDCKWVQALFQCNHRAFFSSCSVFSIRLCWHNDCKKPVASAYTIIMPTLIFKLARWLQYPPLPPSALPSAIKMPTAKNIEKVWLA